MRAVDERLTEPHGVPRRRQSALPVTRRYRGTRGAGTGRTPTVYDTS